jgi:DNA-3-methyladenine glycosylase I
MKLAAGLQRSDDGIVRCAWCGQGDEYVRYHDTEWGVPVADDTRLFEKLALEGFQAGLSWLTILRKRENFRAAFRGFIPSDVARFGPRDVQRLLRDEGIIRHRGKIEAVINNAQLYDVLRADAGSLAAFLWRHEPAKAERPALVTRESIVATVPASHAASKALKTLGWRFVGPTTMYALFQAMGMVNDHIEGCARRPAIERLRRAFKRPG